MEKLLKDSINEYTYKHKKTPSLIVVKPKYWEELLEYVPEKDKGLLLEEGYILRYAGVRVARSNDLLESENYTLK